MTSDGHTQTWEFFAEVAAYDGRAEQVEQWAKRYSRDDMSGGFGLVRDNKKEFLSRFSARLRHPCVGAFVASRARSVPFLCRLTSEFCATAEEPVGADAAAAGGCCCGFLRGPFLPGFCSFRSFLGSFSRSLIFILEVRSISLRLTFF